jgi:ABC-2 type transport system permease protein
MSATIFKHEFNARLKSVIIWSIAMVLLLLVFFSLFPSFSAQAALLDEMLKKFPPALLEMFGMTTMDMASLLGFFSLLWLFVQLCMAIQAGDYGFGLVSVEESELTADFLLSKPVSRLQVLNSKLLAAVCGLLITDVIIYATTFISIAIFGSGHTFDMGTLILILASLMLFQLFFLSVGLVISLLVRRIRSVTPYGLGLAFGTYVINGFSGVFGDIKLEYITPFKHFDTGFIVLHSAYNMPLLILDVAVSLVALAASYWLYLRRDIPAVS